MNIISQILDNDKNKEVSITNFFNENNIKEIMKKCNFNKTKGIPILIVFKFIFTLIFTGKNMYRLMETNKGELPFSKDVVYRFLNSFNYNWIKFLSLLSSEVIDKKVKKLTSADRVNVLIADDTTYCRDRSKNVELISRVMDNSTKKWGKGFKLLTLGWSDGNTFIPIGFNLNTSKEEKKQLQPINKSIDKRTNGYKFRMTALEKKTDAMVELVKKAVEKRIPADYVLFDSWYAFPKIISKIKALKVDVIAMIKKMPNVYYNFNGKEMPLDQIYRNLKKRRGRSKILCSAIVSIKNEDNSELPLKIVFVRNRNKSRDWLALVTTNIELAEKEVVRIYGKRWGIEVFFKMCKSHLNLSKEFQGRSYDSMISHITIVFTRYIMLAIDNRRNLDSKSIGGLFYLYCDELNDVKFSESIKLVLSLLISSIKDSFSATKEEIEALLSNFIDSLPSFFNGLDLKSFCES